MRPRRASTCSRRSGRDRRKHDLANARLLARMAGTCHELCIRGRARSGAREYRRSGGLERFEIASRRGWKPFGLALPKAKLADDQDVQEFHNLQIVNRMDTCGQCDYFSADLREE